MTRTGLFLLVKHYYTRERDYQITVILVYQMSVTGDRNKHIYIKALGSLQEPDGEASKSICQWTLDLTPSSNRGNRQLNAAAQDGVIQLEESNRE